MIPYIRKKHILGELEIKEIVYISDLIPILEDTSESTIRRDLKNLADEGKIELLQGGAAKLKRTSSYDMPLESKKFLHIDEKEEIARCAANLVSDGEVIYIDSGTTTLGLVKYLKNKKIRIVTTNTAIVNLLQGVTFSCHIIGGDVEVSLASTVGPVTENQLRELYFDKAFLGATGFGLKSGITTPDFRESSKKKIVMHNSAKVYVLADSSKYNKQALCKAFELNQCVIITDKPIQDLDGNADVIVADA
jgi:DeoR family fructose operon transcriptional repressor